MAGTKTNAGNFFEDFAWPGDLRRHATHSPVTDGDVALYPRSTGRASQSVRSDTFAKADRYPARAPRRPFRYRSTLSLEKRRRTISLNAIANLGYADCRFLNPVYPGDTLTSTSEVIGIKENSNGETGTVYVRSTGRNQDGQVVLEYCRWVMVRKRSKGSPAPEVGRTETSRSRRPATISRPPFRRSTSRSMTWNSRDHRIAGATMKQARRSITSTA